MLRILSLPFSPLSLLEYMLLASHLQNVVIYFSLMSSGLAVSFVKDGGFYSRERLTTAI